MRGRALIFIYSLFASGVLQGCAASHRQASRIAVLQNAETKQTVECRVDPWGDLNHARQIESCIYAYQKAGYKLLSDSVNRESGD